MIDYGNLQKSLKRLQVQNEQLNTLYDDWPDWVIEAVRESTIRRFEVCWDCLCNVLGWYLREEIQLPKVSPAPRPIIRAASESDLLSSPAEQWLQYAQARGNTTPDYDGEGAEAALALLDDFVDDAIGLYQTMTNETWE